MSETKATHRALMKEFYRRNRWRLVLCVLAGVGQSVFSLYMALLIQTLLDLASTGNGAGLIAELPRMAAMGLMFIVSIAMLALLYPRFLRKASRQYKDQAFARIVRKSISSFSNESTSRYISALTNDVSKIENDWLYQIGNGIQLTLTCLGALAMMLWYSPQLTAWAVGLMLLPLVCSILTGGQIAKAEKEVSDANEGFVAMVKDVLTGFPVVKSFRAEKEVTGIFARKDQQLEDHKCRVRTLKGAVEGLGGLTGCIAQVGVFFVGAWMAVSGQGVTPGVILAFVQMMNYLLQPVQALPTIFAGYKSSVALVDKLATAVEENTRREGKAVDSVLDDAIRLTNVSFGYEKDKPVLRGVTCAFEAGKSYAIVGGSGSGKSTLLNLLLGGYDNYEGSMTVDGEELREIASDALYEMMSIVQQNVFVFDDTIGRNITMFRDFPQAEIDSVIDRSGLRPVVEAKGMAFRCGENGSGLSGGERQRISIARALLRRTPVILVDEATAALDNQTAQEVSQALLSLEGVTRIVVTHRLEEETLRKYDRILVLRGGTVCEQGSFAELMEENGYFRSLYTVSQEN